MLQEWAGQAFNQSPDSANEIHGDEMAKQYGFAGGLVPGVTVSSYLTHPGVEHWGLDFLRCGFAHVKVISPLYDEEQFSVQLDAVTDTEYAAELVRPDGTISARAEVALVDTTAPTRRGDVIAEQDFVGPAASFEAFSRLQAEGCKAFRYLWSEQHRMHTYLRNSDELPELLRFEGGGYANMAFILGMANWILASNAYMNPWVHLETRSQNFSEIADGTIVVAEMAVKDFYEKKGHEFVDVEVALFDEKDDKCLATIAQRAIYKLRGM